MLSDVLAGKTWRELPGYNGLYWVSSCGLVFSNHPNKNKILRPSLHHTGYIVVSLTDSNKQRACHLLHRLVAICFLDNPSALPQINHKDGNKANNHLVNLEWCSGSENCNHAFALGLRDNTGNAKLTEGDVRIIRNAISKGEKLIRIAERYNMHRSSIDRIKKGTGWPNVI